MTVTVRQAKKARAELQGALEYAADYLVKDETHAALGHQAAGLVQRLASTEIEGKETDIVSASDLHVLTEATGLGKTVLEQTDAGRKLARVRGWIEDADEALRS